MRRLTRALVAFAASLGFVAIPLQSQAVSYGYYGCSSSQDSALHMTATRIRYSSTATAIYASATQSHKQVLSWKPDVDWTFYSFTSSGLQTRYYQPTQWGSANNPLPSTARWVTVTWHGRNSGGGTYITSCRTTVGR